jgi:hypothetical protein
MPLLSSLPLLMQHADGKQLRPHFVCEKGISNMKEVKEGILLLSLKNIGHIPYNVAET